MSIFFGTLFLLTFWVFEALVFLFSYKRYSRSQGGA